MSSTSEGSELALVDDFLKQSPDDVVQVGVFEAALFAFGQRSTNGEGDDDVVGVLLGTVLRQEKTVNIFILLQKWKAGELEELLTYMAETPVFAGDRCEKTEANRWVAILCLCVFYTDSDARSRRLQRFSKE